MGPAMRRIFFGLSAAKPASEQRQSSTPTAIRRWGFMAAQTTAGSEPFKDDLGVASGAVADCFVSRVFLRAARVAVEHGLDAIQSFEDCFHAPETAAAKGGQFRFVCPIHILDGCLARMSCGAAKREQQPEGDFIPWLSLFLIIWVIQLIAGRQIGVFFEMLRAQRFADAMLLIEPFAEVDDLATTRAERPVRTGQPVSLFFARRALDFRQPFHGSAQRLHAKVC